MFDSVFRFRFCLRFRFHDFVSGFQIPYFSATMLFLNNVFGCPHENAIVTENATSSPVGVPFIMRRPVTDQKDRGLWERDCTTGTPEDEVGTIFDTGNMRIHWYLHIRTHSRPQSHSALFSPFYKVLSSSEKIRKKKKEKKRKDIYFEI